jgi:hypothetical protein
MRRRVRSFQIRVEDDLWRHWMREISVELEGGYRRPRGEVLTRTDFHAYLLKSVLATYLLL